MGETARSLDLSNTTLALQSESVSYRLSRSFPSGFSFFTTHKCAYLSSTLSLIQPSSEDVAVAGPLLTLHHRYHCATIPVVEGTFRIG